LFASALGADFDGHLIGGTTDAARTHFEVGFDVVQRFMENLNRGFLQLVFNAVKGVVDDALGNGFLPIDHEVVHELGQDHILRTLRAVLRTTLLTVFDALRIEDTTHDVVTHTWKVFHTAATDQDNRVFLKVVAFTTDVADDLKTICTLRIAEFGFFGVVV